MKKEELNEIDLSCNETNAKTSASSCLSVGIFFLGLKRKAHHRREATLISKNKNTPVGGLVSAQENRAITLISLIITIIILLILAGVTINLTIGENGLFRLTQNAGKNYMDIQEKEKNAIANYENKIAGYVDGTRENAKINYSLEEQTIGIKWIDGKEIYQKTMLCEYPSGANSEKLYDVTNLNIEKVISIDAITYYKTSIHALPYIYVGTDGQSIGVSEELIIFDDTNNTKKLRIKTACMDMTGTYVYVTIQYTKAK